MALASLAGLVFAAGHGSPFTSMTGVAAAVLSYGVLVGSRTWRNLAWLAVAVALSIPALVPGLSSQFQGAGPRPVPSILAIILLVGATIAVLVHFVHVPDRRVRLGFALALLGLLVTAGLIIAAVGGYATREAVIAAWIILAVTLALLERNWRSWLSSGHQRARSLSVLIVCKNEGDRIESCLRQVAGWADELVILDSGSTDGTAEIARRYTDRFWTVAWAGYGRQKQRALERCTGDWVLNIDADEIVSDELKLEIDAWLARETIYKAFRICWVSIIFGKPVFFGADGRYHKRLFQREGARFNEADVHEDIVFSGPVATLGAPVIHHTFRDYAHLKEKFTHYALISARRIHAGGSRTGPVLAWMRAVVSFLLLYLRRLGILDGRRGLLMATAYAIYTFDKYVAAWSDRT